jgi:sugar phosphate isomerase/epimerase
MKGHIRIGTLVGLNDVEDALKKLTLHIKYGFESFSLTFWQTTGTVDLAAAAKKVRALTDPAGVGISSISIFGNPLTGHGDNKDTLASWERCIDNAHLFGTDLVTGFTGRIVGKPIEDSIPVFKDVFGKLAARAEKKGVRIAFENCPMGGTWSSGDWNIAINPDAWTLMFRALPNANLGLQWEPCHQMCQLIDPIPQLRRWASRIFNVHGKDATIAWDVIRESGAFGSREWVWHRTPGFGDTNWNDVVTILMQAGYTGSIDIEGYHDPVHRGDLELAGQVRGLEYLKKCRGGDVNEAF